MDISIDDLSLALKNCVNKDNIIRHNCENYLRKVMFFEKFGPSLLKISSDEQYEQQVRLQAAIQLKNYVINFWKFGDNKQINESLNYDTEDLIIIILESDKSIIRKNILDLTTKCTNKQIMKLYNQVIQKILLYEFRNEIWTDFVPTVHNLLMTEKENCVLSGVSAILQISKIFEYESSKYKEKYTEALKSFFPTLNKIMNQVLQNFKINEAALIAKKILDVYLLSIKVSKLYSNFIYNFYVKL